MQRGGVLGRVSIKVGKMMRSRRDDGNAFLRGIISGIIIHGASRLFLPSAAVRHHARLGEENG